MYNICVKFKCVEGKRESFVKRVKEEGILTAILAEDGCHRYDYFYSESDPTELVLIETWESLAHQQEHLKQPHMDTLRSFKSEYITDTEIKEFTI